MTVAVREPAIARGDRRLPAPGDPAVRRGQLPPYWPLALLILPYPLWWLLGIASFMPILVAVPMLFQLRRRSPILFPRGTGWWLAFLGWTVLSAFGLLADAPGAVPGGNVGTRSVIWAYRFALYLAGAVAMVWVANLRRDELPFRKLSSILAWLYVFSAFGGLLGVLAPSLPLTSAVELVLPGSLTSNNLVQSLVHPEVADIQRVLGYLQARPKAPFPYANTWGSVIALSLPFFVLSWFHWGSKRRRLAGAGVLLISLVPIVYSLNRGLWACLAVGVLYLVWYQAREGRFGALAVGAAALAAVSVLFVASPLAGLVVERFENQHSNDRREQLMVQTVESAVTGSPVIGFGGTRDVQGSFASIAGGATPDCPGCGVPPLGTQGHLWLVVFAQGLVGAVLFVMFFLSALWRSVRGRTLAEGVAGAVTLFFLIQILVYDTLGLPLLLVLVAIAAGWREASATARVDTLGSLTADVVGWWRWVALLAALGALAGSLAVLFAPRDWVATEHVLLVDKPSYLPVDLQDRAPRRITIDTEAALVVSEQTLRQVEPDPAARAELRSGLEITAIPNTHVLVISLRSAQADGLSARVQQVASAYLETRREYLLNRQKQVLAELYARAAELASLGRPEDSSDVVAVVSAINQNLLTPTRAGEPFRSEPPTQLRRNAVKYFGSGLALGFLLGGMVVGFSPYRPVGSGRGARVPEPPS